MPPYTSTPIVVAAPLLAERLEQAMAAAPIGVRSLAERSGVDKGTISAWRRGQSTRVRVEPVRKVARVLGTTAEHLLDLPTSTARAPRPVRPGITIREIERAEKLAVKLSDLLAAAAREQRSK